MQRLVGGGKPQVAVLDTGCSSGVGSVGHSARQYCTVAGYYPRSSQPAALPENSVLGFSIKSHIFCLDSHDGLSSSKVYVGFASGACQRPYEPG